jgi:hypothetical protein
VTSKPSAIDTAGIGDLLRDLRKIDKRLGASLVLELRSIGDKSRDDVRNSTAYPYLTGTLRRSVKTGVRRGAIVLYSSLPQSGVIHWGGTIKPRGVPITFPRSEFVQKVVEDDAHDADERLAGVLDATAARYEFL